MSAFLPAPGGPIRRKSKPCRFGETVNPEPRFLAINFRLSLAKIARKKTGATRAAPV
jgi:hypothetical protein